jgi:hypothetical protein
MEDVRGVRDVAGMVGLHSGLDWGWSQLITPGYQIIRNFQFTLSISVPTIWALVQAFTGVFPITMTRRQRQ